MMSTEPVNNPSLTDPPSLLNPTPPVDPTTTPVNPPADPPKVDEPPKVDTPPVEPLTFEALKMPEGFTVDEDTSKSFVELMNDDKLTTAERAQKLIEMQSSLLTKAGETLQKQWSDQQTAWQEEVRADPEIGGDKLEPALGKISQLLDKYGSPELRGVFDATGAGNHPQIVKFLHKIANDLSEGTPVSGAPASAEPSLAQQLYPSMKKQGA